MYRGVAQLRGTMCSFAVVAAALYSVGQALVREYDPRVLVDEFGRALVDENGNEITWQEFP